MEGLQIAFYTIGIVFMSIMLIALFFAIGAFIYTKNKISKMQREIESRLLSLVRPSDVAKSTGMYFLRSFFNRIWRNV